MARLFTRSPDKGKDGNEETLQDSRVLREWRSCFRVPGMSDGVVSQDSSRSDG